MEQNNALTIGVVGTGNMGGAIIRGLSAKPDVFRVTLYDIDAEKARIVQKESGGILCRSIDELCGQSDLVLLAVKPDVIISLVRKHAAVLKQQPVISIAAGISIASIQEALGGGTVIRVMPNTPALIGQGMSVISADVSCDVNILNTAEGIFACLGKTMQLPEKLMDAVTALSGCGPAYAFTVIQAMADGGVKLGIPRDKALVLAAQTLAGAANMVLVSDKGPIELRGMVTSPGGSTIEAVHCLERAGFSGILIDAIEAAARKSEKLGGTKS